jgi:hypothetical protein
MAAPPARTELADTYPLPSNDTYRTGIGRFYDYVVALLGATGTVADARAALAVASIGELQAQTFKSFTTAGTSTAYTVTTVPAIAALADKQEYDLIFHTAPGATPTLARDGLTAKALKYWDVAGAKQPITPTQVPSGWRSPVVYDGTDHVVRDVAGPQSVAYAFSASRSTNQTSGSTLIFDSVARQAGGTNYQPATGIFTAPVAGWYQLSASIRVFNNSGSSQGVGISIIAAGSQVASSSDNSPALLSGGNEAGRSASATVYLTAGQTCTVVSYVSFTANYYMEAGSGSSFSGIYMGS